METVEDLVRAIRQAMEEDGREGDRARAEKDRLWALCVDLVVGLASEFACPGLLRDDLLGEGYLGFEQALAHFEHDRGVPFRGYLHLCVRRRFIDLARKRVELPIEDAGRLDGLAHEDEAGVELRHKEVRAAIDATLAAVLPAASNRARMITAFRKRHLDGWGVAEIQAWLGVGSPGQVSQWVHRVKEAFFAEFPRLYPEFF